MDIDLEIAATSGELNNPNTQMHIEPPTIYTMSKILMIILQFILSGKQMDGDETKTENFVEDSQLWSILKAAVLIMTSVRRVPSHSRWAFLVLGVAFQKYRGDKLITQFDLKLGNISGEAVLNLGKAFGEFIPEIIDEATIMVCYLLVLLLIYPLEPFYKIIFLLKLIFGLLYYIPPLVAKASVVGVNCRFLHLPLFWFITLLAFILSIIVQFLVLLVIYLEYRFIHKGAEIKN